MEKIKEILPYLNNLPQLCQQRDGSAIAYGTLCYAILLTQRYAIALHLSISTRCDRALNEMIAVYSDSQGLTITIPHPSKSETFRVARVAW
mgnify:CR=1 FL=1